MTAIKEGERSFSIPVLSVSQPIGTYYIGVMDSERLCEITDFDVRRLLKERDFERYLGIQRPLDNNRVKEIQDYVTTADACFPAGVILSVPGSCAELDDKKGILTLSSYIDPEFEDRSIPYRSIAKVIDGQHRIEGLKVLNGKGFQVAVSVFIDIDVAEEGYIFSTVNLAQTKVNRSLAFDLYDLARTRSPQKFCHNAAVVLDKEKKSPFYHKIKRLGVATEGRNGETITQATVVDMLMPYVSKDPMKDRDLYLRGSLPERASSQESRILLFRNMFIDERDLEIVDIVWNYFVAVQERWPIAWVSPEKGDMLNKTNGFRAFMRFLRFAYLASGVTKIGDIPTPAAFRRILDRIDLVDTDFKATRFVPGTGGEAALFRDLKEKSGLG